MAIQQILVVDDEKDVLAVLNKRLSSAGYSVITADNGQDAIKLAKDNHPALILLDIMMPELDGPSVARLLKEDPATRGIPVIFLTCLFTKEEEIKRGHAIGDNLFISKPYDPDKLLEEIKKALNK